MRKVFWDDPYQCVLDTTITKVDGNDINVAETIAYHDSGGQESDRAAVNGLPVAGSRMSEDRKTITYTLPENHCLKVGDKVRMEIDWGRRSLLMRYHFCCELVLVLMNRIVGKKPVGEALKPEEIDVIGPFKTGAKMTDTGARVDFQVKTDKLPELQAVMPALIEAFAEVITRNFSIQTGYLDEATQERFWCVEGLATVPCGGTHVRSTKEVGFATLVREKGANNGRGPNGEKVAYDRVKIKLDNLNPLPNPQASQCKFFKVPTGAADATDAAAACATAVSDDAACAAAASPTSPQYGKKN